MKVSKGRMRYPRTELVRRQDFVPATSHLRHHRHPSTCSCPSINMLILTLVLNILNVVCQSISRQYTLFHRIGPSSISANYNMTSLTSNYFSDESSQKLYWEEWQPRGILKITITDPKLKKKTNHREDRTGSLEKIEYGEDELDIQVHGYNRTPADQALLQHQTIERQKSFEAYQNTSTSSSPKTDWFDLLSYQIRLSPLHPQPPSDASDSDPLQLDPHSSFTSIPLSCLISGFEDGVLLSDANRRTDSYRIREYLNVWMKRRTINEARELTENGGSSTVVREEANDSGFPTNSFDLEVLGIQWSTGVITPTACALSSDPSLSFKRLLSFLDLLHSSHLNILIRKPEKLIEPILKPYPIQNAPEYLPDGTIKEPLPQKGWIAKYWMYILPAVVLLVLGGGAPPEEEAGQAPTSTNQQPPRSNS